ncbi:ATPase component of an ABC superfamily vitamin B12 transporter [Yokenella regensburgei ATCC 49455]|uniref:ATP-binding cassette domain-containing protein n=1 Tax=Yokenella regensburgei TaxID=158877 RepID=UPI0004E2A028|nr:ATP-binding cassette domain-containing protein [Yokenella regensburgei]KFD25221.1 ATPase component of an ABC superfamily vitamin B12 transporter [Yokenella regensburgei ATCC 49455]
MTNLNIRQLSVKGRLAPFDACVNPGQLVHLIGPNGAGKSSLLLRLAGLINGGGSISLGTTPFSAMTAHELSMYRACLIQQDLPDLLIPVFLIWAFLFLKAHCQTLLMPPSTR